MQALNPDETRRFGLAQWCHQVTPCDFAGTLGVEFVALRENSGYGKMEMPVCLFPIRLAMQTCHELFNGHTTP
jgi:hypothetical protein